MIQSNDNKEKTSILFVCLGNICRSPTAEGVLRHLVTTQAPQLSVEIDSAGTGDYHLGDPPDARSQRAAMRRGIDLSGLRARQVTARDFAHFDLILAMDRSNLRALQSIRPAASHAQLRLFLEYAGGLDDLEVPDPYNGDASGFERVLDLATLAAQGLIAELRKRS
ncbi:MAG TPA: low molecular weight protein-tyrosine-phosphatase [Steroidobacteraceae bacterium]